MNLKNLTMSLLLVGASFLSAQHADAQDKKTKSKPKDYGMKIDPANGVYGGVMNAPASADPKRKEQDSIAAVRAAAKEKAMSLKGKPILQQVVDDIRREYHVNDTRRDKNFVYEDVDPKESFLTPVMHYVLVASGDKEMLITVSQEREPDNWSPGQNPKPDSTNGIIKKSVHVRKKGETGPFTLTQETMFVHGQVKDGYAEQKPNGLVADEKTVLWIADFNYDKHVVTLRADVHKNYAFDDNLLEEQRLVLKNKDQVRDHYKDFSAAVGGKDRDVKKHMKERNEKSHIAFLHVGGNVVNDGGDFAGFDFASGKNPSGHPDDATLKALEQREKALRKQIIKEKMNPQ